MVAAALLAAALLAPPARAASHALLMTLDYGGTPSVLPGMDLDGRMAREIAIGMGVPERNIVWLRNQALTFDGMAAALQDLVDVQVQEGDKVFLYYSGHGAQLAGDGAGTSKCSEAIVSADLKLFFDEKLEKLLARLAAKASQVVVMNDSCYSAGQATKGLPAPAGEEVVKLYVAPAATANQAGYACSQPVNRALTRSLGIVDARTSTRMLYVAGTADDEAALATPAGSVATLAWHRCLADPAADLDGNGIVDGEELRACAQRVVDGAARRHHQTITLLGDTRLPLSFATGAGSADAPIVHPGRAFETLRQAADPGIGVELEVVRRRLKIDRDLLDLSVRTARAGYLYLLYVSSDGKLVQLFPNGRDRDNRLAAGAYRFPRPGWGIQAQGPVGSGQLIAFLSTAPRDFTKGAGVEGPFAVREANASAVRALAVTTLDGRYGASRVVTIEEVR